MKSLLNLLAFCCLLLALTGWSVNRPDDWHMFAVVALFLAIVGSGCGGANSQRH